MDIESIRFIADQQKEIDSLRRDIENLFFMTKGYQKTMICSDNEYVDYIADFIIKQQQDKI
ncbi:hypothetical protein [uncultured Parabacteroides sp.]|uniref:hypothetical protein n=1 Tax=uncultured Parabacteroides sp. TaxID=512312 RepID=UPI0025E526DF|nr:hypothetical protein [uncultured Parabacteroides sp.]